jgi:hypothetical protein
MKLVDLLTAQPVLQKLTERKMPAKLAYAIAKNFRLIAPELEDYDKARIKLLSDNWKLDEKTNKFDISDEDQAKWKSMHDELLQTESGYQPYKIDLAFAEQIEWAPSELLSLWFIFEGDGSVDLAPKK